MIFAWSDREGSFCLTKKRKKKRNSPSSARFTEGTQHSDDQLVAESVIFRALYYVQLVNDRVGRWSVYVFVPIRHLNSGHDVCGHRCVPNANLYRFLFGILFSQHGEF